MKVLKKVVPLCFVCMSFMLTGCSVKFIEKVPQEETSESVLFTGDIIIDEEPETESSENDFTSETEVDVDDTETEIPEEPQEEYDVEVGGIKFKYTETTMTVYSLVDHVAKTSPHENGKDYQNLKRGDVMSKRGESIDGMWSMVKVAGGPSVYVLTEDITEEYVEPEKILEGFTTEDTEAETTEEPNSSDSQSSSQSQTTSQSGSQSQTQTSQSSQQEVVDNYGGISYPSNASSTSYNMGVEFADLTVTLTVRRDGTNISNGPDRISNSTGYYSLGTVNTGDTVKCTGIGRNGWVRVEYNGQVGFIDGMLVE